MLDYLVGEFIISKLNNHWVILKRDDGHLFTDYKFNAPEEAYFVLCMAGYIDLNEPIERFEMKTNIAN